MSNWSFRIKEKDNTKPMLTKVMWTNGRLYRLKRALNLCRGPQREKSLWFFGLSESFLRREMHQ